MFNVARSFCNWASRGIFLLSLAACSGGDDPASMEGAGKAHTVVVHSSGVDPSIRSVFGAYSESQGVDVEYLADVELAPDEALPADAADLLLLGDAGDLWAAAENGAFRPTYSDVLDAGIPAHLRDPENQWFAYSVRTRVIVFDKRSADPAGLQGYASLAEEKWQGKLCLTTSTSPRSQALVANMISRMGERDAELTVRGWIRNLAAPVFANDAELLQALAAGRCEIGIADTDALWRLHAESVALTVDAFWPAVETGGVQVNISGAGVTRHAKNPDGARALLEWMSTPAAQRLLVADNYQYPANTSVPTEAPVTSRTEFAVSQTNVAQAGFLRADAILLADRARYR